MFSLLPPDLISPPSRPFIYCRCWEGRRRRQTGTLVVDAIAHARDALAEPRLRLPQFAEGRRQVFQLVVKLLLYLRQRVQRQSS